MRTLLIIVAGLYVLTLSIDAHICNDVFEQARDNLVVKVDVRDGQLRISDTAKFRVHLLNTMVAPIAAIGLEVRSDAFDAKVRPSPDWRNFPRLTNVGDGGKKVYFQVELVRKKKTRKGKYKIELVLFGKDARQVFKTLSVEEGMGLMEVPEVPGGLEIDGKTERSEWKDGLLCTSFHEYKRARRYMENFPAAQQTRVRFYHDGGNLYCMVDFQKDTGSDVVQIFIAKDSDSRPETLTAELQSKKVTFSAGRGGLESRAEGTRMEIKVPLSFLGFRVKKDRSGGDKKMKNKRKRRFGRKKEAAKGAVIRVNLTRKTAAAMTYWRGNPASEDSPVAFESFILAGE
ncbi:MAG: hypothetical protein ACYTAF_03800 [Planctomycetota bacterium]|jgi:hypothetical protein